MKILDMSLYRIRQLSDSELIELAKNYGEVYRIATGYAGFIRYKNPASVRRYSVVNFTVYECWEVWENKVSGEREFLNLENFSEIELDILCDTMRFVKNIPYSDIVWLQFTEEN